jgi:hypothetical protein
VLGGFILGFTIGIIIDQSHKPLGVSKVDGTYVQVLIGGVDGPVTAVVVDADAISQTDTDGADIIALLAGNYAHRASPWRSPASSRRSWSCGPGPAPSTPSDPSGCSIRSARP